MVNLASNDAGRFDLVSVPLSHKLLTDAHLLFETQVAISLPYLLVAPLLLVEVSLLTWLILGPASLAGTALVMAFIALQGGYELK